MLHYFKSDMRKINYKVLLGSSLLLDTRQLAKIQFPQPSTSAFAVVHLSLQKRKLFIHYNIVLVIIQFSKQIKLCGLCNISSYAGKHKKIGQLTLTFMCNLQTKKKKEKSFSSIYSKALWVKQPLQRKMEFVH